MPYVHKTGSKILRTFIAAVLLTALILNTTAGVYAAGGAQSDVIVFTKKNIPSADLRSMSDITLSELQEYLTRFPKLADISEKLLSVQEEYGVNAIFMLAVIRLESGNGTSTLALKKHNLGGITAVRGGKVIYRAFDGKSECVEYMAKLLSENYLTPGGKYFNGYTVRSVSVKYCVSSEWTPKIEKIMLEIQNAINKIKNERLNL